MLDDILLKTGAGSKKKLHKALKEAKGINSLTDLTKQELYIFMVEIDAFFASEHGIEVLGDEKQTLSEYFGEIEKGKT